MRVIIKNATCKSSRILMGSFQYFFIDFILLEKRPKRSKKGTISREFAKTYVQWRYPCKVYFFWQATYCWLAATWAATSTSPTSGCPRSWTRRTTRRTMGWTWPPRGPELTGTSPRSASSSAKTRQKSPPKSTSGQSVSYSTNASTAKRWDLNAVCLAASARLRLHILMQDLGHLVVTLCKYENNQIPPQVKTLSRNKSLKRAFVTFTSSYSWGESYY